MEHWTDKLVEMKACPDAVAWARSYTTPEAAWEACERPDRMFWVASRLATLRRHHQAIVLAVADCAQTALKYVPAGEGRPLAAIEAAEKWALAPSEENRAAAGSAAWAAWIAAWAARDAARDAAWAACDAAWAAAWATETGWAACDATGAAAKAITGATAGATAGAANRMMADIVRSILGIEFSNGHWGLLVISGLGE